MSDGKAAVFSVRAISPRGGESAGAGPIHHHLGAGPGSGQPGAEEEVSAPAARAPTPGTSHTPAQLLAGKVLASAATIEPWNSMMGHTVLKHAYHLSSV